eukprot:jgi/Tetstr1/421598/TSEL_012539.t1
MASPRAAEGDRHRVLMVSDFFYPNCGGVENHVYQLSQCLMARGHKVVVLTHAYGDRTGVRYLTNGLKVYYVPRVPFYQQNTFPTLYGLFPLLRVVLLRERITLVHGHQAFSNLAHEAMLHARTMGYRVAFTDHSLFGFADLASILMNKVLKFSLADCQHVVCVSHTSKENTVLRACVPPNRVSVIPNAVDATNFTPSPAAREPGVITIVVLSRMMYRKGIDLLAVCIPVILQRHRNVKFVIGGDGPKLALLKAMVEQEGLHDRVELLGAVAHEKARDVLARGHIFINASLTEAFCMAIVEAASTGLLVVATAVGGVPEVLPDGMVILCEPSPEALAEAVGEAVLRAPLVDPIAQHRQLRSMYTWAAVAQRVEAVYDTIAAMQWDHSLLGRLQRMHRCGSWAGKLFCAVVAVDCLYLRWLEWWRPAADIDPAPDFPCS